MNVLLTGGTGLVGTALKSYLEKEGHEVAVLSRTKNLKVKSFHWSPSKNEIDIESLKWADSVIHLAGAGIVDKKWTKSRKKVLVESRVNTANLIYNSIKENKIKIKSFVSTSGINYYGTETTDQIYSEDDKAGNDFVSQLCVEWEKAALQFKELSIPTTILRTGIVLSKDGGALTKMAKPIKIGIGSPLGTGKQYVPWIHIHDLCALFSNSISKVKYANEIINAVAPQHITNKELTDTIAKVINKKIWAPNVPAFVLKIILGSRANLVLKGSRISFKKPLEMGFNFTFEKLNKALLDIYK